LFFFRAHTHTHTHTHTKNIKNQASQEEASCCSLCLGRLCCSGCCFCCEDHGNEATTL
jgi:hypothetical protein